MKKIFKFLMPPNLVETILNDFVQIDSPLFSLSNINFSEGPASLKHRLILSDDREWKRKYLCPRTNKLFNKYCYVNDANSEYHCLVKDNWYYELIIPHYNSNKPILYTEYFEEGELPFNLTFYSMNSIRITDLSAL